MGKRMTIKKLKKTIRHKVGGGRKLVSSSLRKSNSPKGRGFPKIYVINLKKDKKNGRNIKRTIRKAWLTDIRHVLV